MGLIEKCGTNRASVALQGIPLRGHRPVAESVDNALQAFEIVANGDAAVSLLGFLRWWYQVGSTTADTSHEEHDPASVCREDAAPATASAPLTANGSVDNVRATLQKTFARFDVDRNGSIECNEVWPLCYALGYALKSQQVRDSLNELCT
eukprot:SAG31_NODE_8873_length_1369_cov_1.811811_2_plen_150_part_00